MKKRRLKKSVQNVLMAMIIATLPILFISDFDQKALPLILAMFSLFIVSSGLMIKWGGLYD